VNGIQAMPDGGDLKIGVSTEMRAKPTDDLHIEREMICISIQDSGEGMRPDVIEKIFDPFFTTKDVGSGTGLGLSISHGIIEEHGGWIEVKSRVGEGTTFRIYLPVGEKHE
jgi:two-component system, NtrC family, sensor kinase